MSMLGLGFRVVDSSASNRRNGETLRQVWGFGSLVLGLRVVVLFSALRVGVGYIK